MMIGAEKGSHDITLASRDVGLSRIGLMKIAVATRRISIGCTACCASCSVLTDAPTAAYSDE